jgi:copper homeostasis protein CutC
LVALTREFGQRIGILPGGQVRARNVARIIQSTGVSEVHIGFPADAEPDRVREVVAALADGGH